MKTPTQAMKSMRRQRRTTKAVPHNAFEAVKTNPNTWGNYLKNNDQTTIKNYTALSKTHEFYGKTLEHIKKYQKLNYEKRFNIIKNN